MVPNLLLTRPHLGFPRKIHPNQKIHSSFILTDKTRGEYTPKARPLLDDAGFWEEVRRKGHASNWLELDLYEYMQTVVKSLVSEFPGPSLQTLCQTAMSGMSAQCFRFFHIYMRSFLADGLQAVYDAVIGALSEFEPEAKLRLLESAVDIIGGRGRGNTSFKLGDSIKIRASVSDVPKTTENHQKLVQQFLVWFTDCKCKTLSSSLSDWTACQVAYLWWTDTQIVWVRSHFPLTADA